MCGSLFFALLSNFAAYFLLSIMLHCTTKRPVRAIHCRHSPTYAAAFGMPMDALVGMGSAVNKAITSLPTFVLFAVVPFNIIKGVVVSLVTMLLYKHISRLLKGEAMN